MANMLFPNVKQQQSSNSGVGVVAPIIGGGTGGQQQVCLHSKDYLFSH